MGFTTYPALKWMETLPFLVSICPLSLGSSLVLAVTAARSKRQNAVLCSTVSHGGTNDLCRISLGRTSMYIMATRRNSSRSLLLGFAPRAATRAFQADA